jgi:hypothetical protein
MYKTEEVKLSQIEVKREAQIYIQEEEGVYC